MGSVLFLVVSFIVKGTWFSTRAQLKSLFSKSMWEKLFPPMVIRVVSTILEQELNPCLRKGCCHNVACWWASAKKKIKRNRFNDFYIKRWLSSVWIYFVKFHLMLIFHFLQIVPQILKHWAIIRILLPAVLHYLVTRIEKKKTCVMALRNLESSSQCILHSHIRRKVGISYA